MAQAAAARTPSIAKNNFGYFGVLADEMGDKPVKSKKRRRGKPKSPFTPVSLASPVVFATSTEPISIPVNVRDVSPAGVGVASVSPVDGISAARAEAVGDEIPDATAISVANLLSVPWSELTGDQQNVFRAFVRDLGVEYPELLKALVALKDPKDFKNLSQAHKNAFLNFLLTHEGSLKTLLGYATTAFPIFIQYLYPPYESIPNRSIAGIFAFCGIFVNVALTGVVAGPLFADTIIMILKFLKKMTVDQKPKEALLEALEYWYPEEWTKARAAYLRAYAEAQDRSSSYIALQQAFSVTLPLLRSGVTGLSIYASWILGKAFAGGALNAEKDTCYPFELSSNLNAFVFWWIVVANAVTYGLDATLAFISLIRYSPRLNKRKSDEDLEKLLVESLNRIKAMDIKTEMDGTITPLIEEWLQSCNAKLQPMIVAFKDKFISLLDTVVAGASFGEQFRLLLQDIIKNGHVENIDATNKKITSICLPPEVLDELVSQVLRSKYDEAKSANLTAIAKRVLHENEIDASLRMNEKQAQREMLADFMQSLAKRSGTQKIEDHVLSSVYNKIVQFLGTSSSLVFALAVIPFFESAADTNLFGASLAAFIVYYFSDIYFYKGLKQASDGFMCATRIFPEDRWAAAKELATLVLGLGTAGFSAASAMYQAGSGDAPPGILGAILAFINTQLHISTSVTSAVNAAAVNSYGSVQLYRMLIDLIINSVKSCQRKPAANAYSTIYEDTSTDSSESEAQPEPGCFTRLNNWWYGISPKSRTPSPSTTVSSTSPLLSDTRDVTASQPVNFTQGYHLMLNALLAELKTHLAEQHALVATFVETLNANKGNVNVYGTTLLEVLKALTDANQVVWFAKCLKILGWNFACTAGDENLISLKMTPDTSARFASTTFMAGDEAKLASMQAQLRTEGVEASANVGFATAFGSNHLAGAGVGALSPTQGN